MEFGAMFRFKRSEVQPGLIEAFKRDLVKRQRGGEKYGFGKGKTVTLYREQADTIEIPRYYALREFPPGMFQDKTTEGQPAPFKFTRDLRPNQTPVVAEFLSRLGKRGSEYGGILCSPCGSGKTIEALYLLSKLGRASIVLVHAEFLMTQWREAILGNATTSPPRLPFTDLRPEDVGTIQQDEEDWQGKKIVLAMVETLINREYGPDFYDNFGVVCLDEVHRHGAMEWHKAMTKFPAKYRIGLSATPARGDGLWDVIKFHIGNIIARGGESEKATVYVVPTGVAVHDEFYKQYDAEGEETDNIALARLLKVLCKSDYRNRLIAKEIFKAYKAGRRVLVLSDRLAHLDALEELFVADWKKETPQEEQMALAMGNRKPADDVLGRYTGGISQDDIERAKTCRVLLGTYQYAKEGLDDPMLDTLILATPKGNVIQAVGRILRTVEGKKPPLVIDIHDEKTDACRDFLDRRMRGYAERGYEVKKIEKTP